MKLFPPAGVGAIMAFFGIPGCRNGRCINIWHSIFNKPSIKKYMYQISIFLFSQNLQKQKG